MASKVVEAVSFDLSQTFGSSEQIKALVEALGNPPELANSRHLDRPGAFWRFTFEPWLESALEVNLEAVYRAHERIRPGELLPGVPPPPRAQG